MAEQQALLERPIEAAAYSDSGYIAHTLTPLNQLNTLSHMMANFRASW